MAVKCCECGGTSFVKNSCYETVCRCCGLIVSTESRLENEYSSFYDSSDCSDNKANYLENRYKNEFLYKKIKKLKKRNFGLTLSERYFKTVLNCLKPFIKKYIDYYHEKKILSLALKLHEKIKNQKFIRRNSAYACVIYAVRFFYINDKIIDMNELESFFDKYKFITIKRVLRFLESTHIVETRTPAQFISQFETADERKIAKLTLKLSPVDLKLSNRRLLYVFISYVVYRVLKNRIKLKRLEYIQRITNYQTKKIQFKLENLCKYKEKREEIENEAKKFFS